MDNRNLNLEQLAVLRRKIVEAVITKKYRQSVAASIYGFRKATVSHYIKAYKRFGEASLVYQKRGRRAETCTKLSKQEEIEVRETIIRKTPDKLDLPCVLWTRKAVREFIENKYNTRFSIRGMGDALKRWGFTPQKPLKVALQQNPKKVKQWLEIEYPKITKQAKKENADIFWGDEMGLSSTDQRGRSYGIKGKTPGISKTGSRFRCNMISAITNQGHMRWMIFEGSCDVSVFLTFLKRLIYRAKKKIFLIVDNLRVHHAKKVNDWLKEHKDDIKIFYLPPYSPELNPQELVNQEIKSIASNSGLVKSMKDLQNNLACYLKKIQLNSQKVRNYFKKSTVKYAA